MALLPPAYLDAVVALGSPISNGEIKYKATGFLYGYPIEGSDGQYRIFLITNRHVFENLDMLKVRFNRPMGSDSKIYDLDLIKSDGSAIWTGHSDSNCDVAVIPILAGLLGKDGIEFKWFSENNILTLEQAKELRVSEGDGVFVLGFPLGQPGEKRSYVIVRQGTIARIRDWIGEDSRTILIDSSIFPGNSGGPVITRPENFAIEGTKHNNQALLIGMVSAYIPYEDIAISSQTGKPRVIFQENSGLAVVVPADVIHEAVEIASKKINIVETPQQSASTPEVQSE